MHTIEPFYNWRDRYIAAKDERSPFYGYQNSEFEFTHKIYNYLIHPQWDAFGSPTLYMKVIFADYDSGFAIIELLGEWNDCIQNDVMFVKREVADLMMEQGIFKYIIIGENLLNFHGGDDDYYQEWSEEVREEGGWICFLNLRDHVIEEMAEARLQFHIHFDAPFNQVSWRPYKPKLLFQKIDEYVLNPQHFILPH